MIQKLLLVRKADMRSDLIDQAGVRAFAGEPLNVTPIAWSDESGISHYGFVLTDMKLADWQALQAWLTPHGGITVLDFDGDVAAALASVGLRINESA